MSNDIKYESKAITTQIRATARASVKIKESFYTFEYSEERTIPQVDGVDLNEERQALWDAVNDEVYFQVDDMLNSVAKKK